MKPNFFSSSIILSCSFLTILMLSFSSCGLTEQIDRSVNELTAASRQINANASNAIEILRGIKDDFAPEIKDIIDNDVDRLIKTSIQTTSEEARCDLTFLGKRIKNGLENTIIRIKNLGNRTDNKPLLDSLSFKPSFCTISPAQVDLNADNTKPMQISGYDFNDLKHLKVVLVALDGKKKDITDYLSHSTDYMLTLRTDSSEIFKNFTKVLFLYGDKEAYSILIVPRTPSICKEYSQLSTPIPDVINFFAGKAPGVGGDDDFAGDVRVGIGAELSVSSDKKAIVCNIGFYADEVNGDTHARYDGASNIFSAPDGYLIKSINSPTKFGLSYVQKGNDPLPLGGNGCVAKIVVRADHKGDDVPGYTGAEVYLNSMNVTFIEDNSNGDCITKDVYSLAHPTGSISDSVALSTKFITPKQLSIITSIDKLNFRK